MKIKAFKKLFIVAFFGFSIALLPVTQVISAELAAPQVAIEEMSNQLKIKLQDDSFIKDFVQINGFVKEVISPHVDFSRISALVLGKLWKKATKQEKARFRQEFQTLLIRTYSRAFLEFKDWNIKYLPLKLGEGTRKVLVKTRILQPGIQPLAVNYRMLLTRGHWKVYDILIEGVSLVTNYRTSIKNEYKRTGSIDAIIEKLAKRNTAALQVKDNS